MTMEVDHRKQWDETPQPGDVFAKLRWGSQNLSARQAALCLYILDNYQQVAFWSVEELSQKSGTSPATVVRAVKSLGFSSYHDMLKCFERLIIDNKTSVFWETEISWKENTEDVSSLSWIARDNIRAIQDSVTPSILTDIRNAAELLRRARRIHLIAFRSSRAAAVYFHATLAQSFDNVSIVQYGGDELFDTLIDLTPSDAVIAISLGGPHFTRMTIRALRYAKRSGIPTILVTNDLASPACEFATVRLIVANTRHHYSITPTLTVLETLLSELGRKEHGHALIKLRKLEKVLEEEEITL
jgi:DNA-binding MurR/RpiR family transcriptional regulator